MTITKENPVQILFVGDGNFSFTLSLCQLLWPKHSISRQSLAPDAKISKVEGEQMEITDITKGVKGLALAQPITSPEAALKFLAMDSADTPMHITATSFDSNSEVLRKYPESRGILERLERFPNVTVLHGINAWQLAEQFPERQFDQVIWNHPHLGLEDFRLHRFLLAHFLQSAKGSLSSNGAVVVSLVDGQEERWNLIGQAARAGLRLADRQVFDSLKFPGYEAKRNKNGQSFKNLATQKHMGNYMSSHTYRFTMQGNDASSQVDLPSLYLPVNSWVQNKPPPTMHFHCKHCSKGFTSERGVKVHTRQVHELKKYGDTWAPDMPKVIPCVDCKGEMFADDTALWQHRIARHSGEVTKPEKPLTDSIKVKDEGVLCHVCGQNFPLDWGMSGHLESMKPILGLNVQCHLCPATFTEHRALRQHINFCRLTKTTTVQDTPVACN